MMENKIRAEIIESVGVYTAIQYDNHLIEMVKNVVNVCVSALNNNRKLLFMGNGGSAADCQHLAGEMVSRLSFDRPGLPAFALTVDSSVMTAIANDYGYDYLFSRQVEALARPGDVLFGISTSGCSANVLAGLHAARKLGVITIGMTGNQKADIVQASNYVIEIPSSSTPKIQEGHILIGHIICSLIEERLFEHLK